MKQEDIREYDEGMEVELIEEDHYASNGPRHMVRVFNECGHTSVKVDLIDLLHYVKEEMPEVWAEVEG